MRDSGIAGVFVRLLTTGPPRQVGELNLQKWLHAPRTNPITNDFKRRLIAL